MCGFFQCWNLPRQPTLHHARTCKDNTRPDVVEVIDPLQVGDVLEHEGIVDGDLAPNPLVHRVDEGLVDGHALLAREEA